MQIPFRTRVALSNAAILAVAMLLIAWLSVLSLRTGINTTIDRMLEARVNRGLLMRAGAEGIFPEGMPFAPAEGMDPSDLPPFIRARIQRMRKYSMGLEGGPEDGGDAPTPMGPPPLRLADAKGNPVPEGANPLWDPQAASVALAGKSNFTSIHRDGVNFRVYTAPEMAEGRVAGVMQTARALSDFDKVYHDHMVRVLVLVPIGVALALAVGLFLANQALGPIRKVTLAAAEIEANDLSRRLTVNGTDELSELARTFNGMIARLDTAFEQQRQFTADASHELRTPLARMKLTLSEALSQGASIEDLQEALRIADAAADRLGSLAEDLLILTRSDAGQLPLRLRRMDLSALVRDAVALWEEAGPEFRVELPAGPLLVEADPAHLHRALDNLLQNAVRHTPKSGSVTVSAHSSPGSVVLSVRDTGEGIPAVCLPHVCERFYQVEAARSPGSEGAETPRGGSGLGLAIVRSLVQAHGGTLDLVSEVGSGTEVILVLPAASPSA